MQRQLKFRAWTEGRMTKPTDLQWLKRGADIPEDFHQMALWDLDAIFMQYTGLKDKNGKEIYEGDICKWFGRYGTNQKTTKVIFDSGMFCFLEDGILVKIYSAKKIEIIGNIYENPELLNK